MKNELGILSKFCVMENTIIPTFLVKQISNWKTQQKTASTSMSLIGCCQEEGKEKIEN